MYRPAKIIRAWLDGTNMETFVDTLLGSPVALAYDLKYILNIIRVSSLTREYCASCGLVKVNVFCFTKFQKQETVLV